MAEIRAVFERTSDGAQYQMSDDDVAMMARALYGEKHGKFPAYEEAAAICWTWLNRYMLWPGGMSKWDKADGDPHPIRAANLAKVIKYQSQTTSPKWRRDGSSCKGKTTGNCAPSRLKWRDKMAHTPLAQTPIKFRQFAADFAAGNVAYYPFVDFASFAWAVNHGVQVMPGGESFLEKDVATPKGWKPGEVIIVGKSYHGGGLSLPAKIGIGVFIAAVAWSGYQLLK